MQVKGVTIRGLLSAIDIAFGPGASRRIVDALAPEIRAVLEPVVLASSMYAIEVPCAIHEAVRQELGGGSVIANRKLGAAAARDDFRGVYRIFIRIADYPRLLQGIERAWRQYNSRGTVSWTLSGASEAECVIGDVSGYSEAMWHSIAGRFETMLVLGGAKHASVAVGDWSDEHVSLRARWAP